MPICDWSKCTGAYQGKHDHVAILADIVPCSRLLASMLSADRLTSPKSVPHPSRPQLYIASEPEPFGDRPPTWRAQAYVLGHTDMTVSLLIDNSFEGQINSFQRSLCTPGAILAVVNTTVQKKGATHGSTRQVRQTVHALYHARQCRIMLRYVTHYCPRLSYSIHYSVRHDALYDLL